MEDSDIWTVIYNLYQHNRVSYVAELSEPNYILPDVDAGPYVIRATFSNEICTQTYQLLLDGQSIFSIARTTKQIINTAPGHISIRQSYYKHIFDNDLFLSFILSEY